MNAAGALAQILNRPLAYELAALEARVEALKSSSPIVAATSSPRQTAVADTLGVLPIVGDISYRPTFWSEIFGGTDLVSARERLRTLVRNRSVTTIMVLFDSPGGECTGLDEFSYELRQARRVKPVLGLVDSAACSAAYYLAAQCDELYLTPSSRLGSVGVWTMHVDRSSALEKAGLRPTLIHAGRYKVEGNPVEPLSDPAKAQLQQEVDRILDEFVANIVAGRGRGLTEDTVRKTFGEGRVINDPRDAIRRGMADRLFPTVDLAVAHVAAHQDRVHAANVQADINNVDWWLAEHGEPAESEAALQRLRQRVMAPTDDEGERQRIADMDAANAAVVIAERAGGA